MAFKNSAREYGVPVVVAALLAAVVWAVIGSTDSNQTPTGRSLFTADRTVLGGPFGTGPAQADGSGTYGSGVGANSGVGAGSSPMNQAHGARSKRQLSTSATSMPPPTTSPYFEAPTSSTIPSVAMNLVEWSQVSYPGSCNQSPSPTGATANPSTPATSQPDLSTGFTVDQVSFVQPDAADQLAVVSVQCGSGTRPLGLFVYEGATSATQPTLIQQLIPISQDVFSSGFNATGASVTIRVTSGSPNQDGACCAGLSYVLSWTWSQGKYRPS